MPSTLVSRAFLRQRTDKGTGVTLAGICAGGTGQPVSLPRHAPLTRYAPLLRYYRFPWLGKSELPLSAHCSSGLTDLRVPIIGERLHRGLYFLRIPHVAKDSEQREPHLGAIICCKATDEAHPHVLQVLKCAR